MIPAGQRGNMEVYCVYAGGILFWRTERSFLGFGQLMGDTETAGREDACLKSFLEAASLSSSDSAEGGALRMRADPAEASLLLAAQRGGLRLADVRSILQKVAEISYDSARRRTTTVHAGRTGTCYGFTKGDLDAVLSACSYEMRNGARQPLSCRRVFEICSTARLFSAAGYTIVAAAHRTIGSTVSPPLPRGIETDLTFLGFAVIAHSDQDSK